MKRRISFRNSKTVESSSPSRSAGRWPPADRALASRGSWDWLAFPHQARIGPELLRAARPALIGLALLALVGGAAFLLVSSRRGDDVDTEIRLLAEAPSPNLNSSSAETPEPEPAPRTELVPPVAPPVMPLPPVETARVEVHPAPPLPQQPASSEPARLEPLTPDAGAGVVLVPAHAPALENDMIDVRLSQLGDTPMIHEWKMLGLQTVLAGALVAATTGITPAEAQEKASSDVKKDDVSEQLKALQAQMKTLNESMLGLGGAIEKDVKKIREDINRLSNDVIASKDKAEKAFTGVDNLRKEVDRLRTELEALRNQVASARTSNYPQAQPSTGRVRLVNTFNTPVTILVNNKAYEVMPGETRLTDALPAGTINYEVLGIQAARNTRLDPNETLTINVYTRQ